LPRFCANLALLFTEQPFLDRPAAAAAAGFTEIEVWWPFATARPSQPQIRDFVTSVRSAGVQLIGINLFDGDRAAGERGILTDPGRTELFRATVEVGAQIGSALGCRNFNVLYGNRSPDVPATVQDDLAELNLTYARDRLAQAGGRVLIEPLSAVPTYPIKTADAAASVIARVGEIAMLFDVYHLAVNGVDVRRAIRQHHVIIGHVQLADSPGRHEPGTGILPFDAILEDLADVGYAGPMSLEYIPAVSTAHSLASSELVSRSLDRSGHTAVRAEPTAEGPQS
jgi:hydroxypyruvate isomerase